MRSRTRSKTIPRNNERRSRRDSSSSDTLEKTPLSHDPKQKKTKKLNVEQTEDAQKSQSNTSDDTITEETDKPKL